MKKFLTILALAATVCLAGCNDDTDDLWNEVNELKSRVTALETQVVALNENIEALSQLVRNGATITDVKQADGTYTITLSNGEVITLHQGSAATAVIPVIGIDAENYWVVDYKDGKGFVRIEVDGKPVKATAADGVTPKFRIDADSCWEVSYDGGESWEPVLDTNGNRVSAVGTGTVTDKFFADVKVEGDKLHIELLTGESIDVPIVPDFYCRIVAPAGVQNFSSKETKRFEVEIKGVENVLISAPTGWSAQLTDMVSDKATLIVTAPETTRALADNSKDVAILATAGYYACIAKIQVETEGGVVTVPPTVESVEAVAEAATSSSLTFRVAVSEDTDAWMYLVQESSAPAPEASTVATIGKNGVGDTAVETGLNASTDYTIYVIAIKNPNTYSEVVSAAGRTTDPVDEDDYYTFGVEIDGVRYDKDSEGAQLLEVPADAAENVTLPVAAGGVYFVDDQSVDYAVGTFSSQGVTKDLVIIGRRADKKTEIKVTHYWALRNPSGKLIFKNVKIDFSGVDGNYMFNAATSKEGDKGGMDMFVFEDCELIFSKKAFVSMYNADADACIGNIVFRNCKLHYTGSEVTVNFITLQKIGAGLNKFRSFVFENNMLYTESAATVSFSLFFQDNTSTSGSLENLNIVCRNNTFVNIVSSGSKGGLFNVEKFGSFLFSKNVLWSTNTDKYSMVLRVMNDYNTAGSWPTVTMAADDNVAWGTKGYKLWSNAAGTFYPEGADKLVFTVASEDPLSVCDFANGRFVVAPAYAGFGSTLE